MKQKKYKENLRFLKKLFFFAYLLFLLYFLLFTDWYGRQIGVESYHYNLIPFREIRRFIVYREQLGQFAVWNNLFGNILIFVPFGFFIPMTSGKKNLARVAFSAFRFSFLVELLQLIIRVGSFDVDDMILNTSGAILGYVGFLIYYRVRKSYVRQKKIQRAKKEMQGQVRRRKN